MENLVLSLWNHVRKIIYLMIVVSQLPGLISGVIFPVMLDSQSQLVFLKVLWRHIFSKTHLTYSFIRLMSYIYIFYIHIVTMHAISISSTFYSLYTFSFICIYIVILQTISLFCIVFTLAQHWCTLLCFYVPCILYVKRQRTLWFGAS